MIRALLRVLFDALSLGGATMQRALTYQEDELIPLPFCQSDRVVVLPHAVVGSVVCRWEDPEEVEDAYVISTDDGRILVAPEGVMRPA
jgi:hypothetical protein